jgi:hypothetical protein
VAEVLDMFVATMPRGSRDGSSWRFLVPVGGAIEATILHKYPRTFPALPPGGARGLSSTHVVAVLRLMELIEMKATRCPILLLAVTCLVPLAPASAGGATAGGTLAVRAESYAPLQLPLGGPALDLFLSGSTDLSNEGCGAKESFAVPPGTDIRFCYFAGNPGSVAFTRHDLEDSFGTIFADFPFVLEPSQAMYLMYNRQPHSSGSNTAQWTAYNPGPADLVSAGSSTPIEITAPLVSCNGATSTFSDGIPVGWTSYDWLALAALPDSSVDWADLGTCGESANYTGGRGGAACASSDLADPQAFDTQLRTHSFSLAGETSASIEFLLNYQDFASGDALYIDYSLDGGETWTNLAQSTVTDYGAFRDFSGASLSIDLAPVLGNPDVRLGWRYVDASPSASDYYIQIDNVRLVCGNGIFSDGYESGDSDAWTEAVLQ